MLPSFCRSTTAAACSAGHEFLYALCLGLPVEWISCFTNEPFFLVEVLKAVLLSSFSGITRSITYISAACAFITREQPLGSLKQLSAQARSRLQIQNTSPTYLSSAGSRSWLPFEDVLKSTSDIRPLQPTRVHYFLELTCAWCRKGNPSRHAADKGSKYYRTCCSCVISQNTRHLVK